MEIHNRNTPHLTFGWRYPMHKTLLIVGAKDKTIAPDVMETLLKSVQSPDLDEFFLYGQKHFYYPNSFLKSYMDITGTHNAKYSFFKHIKQMLKGKNPVENMGRALHYLQDITQPNHIEVGSIIRKAKDAKMHHYFEVIAHNKEMDLIGKAKPVTLNEATFEDLFEKVLQLSSLNETPSNKNFDNWLDIAQKGVNLAISATGNFFNLIKI